MLKKPPTGSRRYTYTYSYVPMSSLELHETQLIRYLTIFPITSKPQTSNLQLYISFSAFFFFTGNSCKSTCFVTENHYIRSFPPIFLYICINSHRYDFLRNKRVFLHEFTSNGHFKSHTLLLSQHEVAEPSKHHHTQF
jgi:hypothetical protein